MNDSQDDFAALLAKTSQFVAERDATLCEAPITPTADAVHEATAALPTSLPPHGKGTAATLEYLMSSVLPGCVTGQAGPRYFGFVTGGVTPAAQLADMLVSSLDENVQVAMPDTSVSTAFEARTLEMVLDLLAIPRNVFMGRTITTGATASNILGLAPGYSYAENGPPGGMPSPPIVILTLHPHFSIRKAAALVGIGNGPHVIHAMPADPDDELTFDIEALRGRLVAEHAIGRGVIVAYGLGEVNTGGFGRRLPEVAALCRRYGAWLHIDAAFGGFAAAVPELQYQVEGMDQADSLTLDGHKWLNVPYDCGLFFTRDSTTLPALLGPSKASTPAYLASSSTAAANAVVSPLYVNIENSRRFRALPLFASLVSLGREGYIDIVRRNVAFANRVAAYLASHPSYQLLNASPECHTDGQIIPLNIVLFRGAPGSRFPPDEEGASTKLVAAINQTRLMYVTHTEWRGSGAVRLAVSNWRTGERDWDIVRRVLEGVMSVK